MDEDNRPIEFLKMLEEKAEVMREQEPLKVMIYMALKEREANHWQQAAFDLCAKLYELIDKAYNKDGPPKEDLSVDEMVAKWQVTPEGEEMIELTCQIGCAQWAAFSAMSISRTCRKVLEELRNKEKEAEAEEEKNNGSPPFSEN